VNSSDCDGKQTKTVANNDDGAVLAKEAEKKKMTARKIASSRGAGKKSEKEERERTTAKDRSRVASSRFCDASRRYETKKTTSLLSLPFESLPLASTRVELWRGIQSKISCVVLTCQDIRPAMRVFFSVGLGEARHQKTSKVRRRTLNLHQRLSQERDFIGEEFLGLRHRQA